MAYTVKYYGEWKDYAGNNMRLELLTNAVNTATEVKVNGCVVEYPDIEWFGKDSVFGAGIEIILLSPTRLFYEDAIYTTDPKGIQIRLLKNAAISFLGWVDSEQYEDEFTQQINYEITITGNNGIALLDRFTTTYTSMQPTVKAYDLLLNAIAATGLPYTHIQASYSTLIAAQKYLDVVYNKIDNFIDEKGIKMSWREALESCLFPAGLRMFASGSTVYVVDSHTQASTGAYVRKSIDGTSTISGGQPIYEIDDILDAGSRSNMRPVNRVSLKFNKYKYGKITFPINENTVSGSAGEIIRTDPDGKEFTEKLYDTCTGIVIPVNPSNKFVLVYDNSTGKMVDGFLRCKELATEIETTAFSLYPDFLLTSAKQRLTVNFDYQIEDVRDYQKDISRIETNNLNANANYVTQFKIIDAAYTQYINSLAAWQSTAAWVESKPLQPLKFLVANRWVFNVNKYLPASSNVMQFSTTQISGLSVPLNSDSAGTPGRATSIRGGKLGFIMRYERFLFTHYSRCFRNIAIYITEKDEFGNYNELVVEDEEIEGSLDANAKDSIELKTTSGTDTTGATKGGLLVLTSGLYSDSNYATNQRLTNLSPVTRGAVTDDLESLLLRTYLSNLNIARKEVECTVRDYLTPNGRYNHSLVKRGVNPCLMVAENLEIDYLAAESKIKLLEIVSDNPSI